MWVSVIRSEEKEIKKEIRAVGKVNIQQNVYIIYYCCSILWWSLQLRYDEGDTIMVIQDHVIENPLVLCYTKSSTLSVAFCSHDNRVSLLFILFFSILSFSIIQTNRILIFVYNNKKKNINLFSVCFTVSQVLIVRIFALDPPFFVMWRVYIVSRDVPQLPVYGSFKCNLLVYSRRRIFLYASSNFLFPLINSTSTDFSFSSLRNIVLKVRETIVIHEKKGRKKGDTDDDPFGHV